MMCPRANMISEGRNFNGFGYDANQAVRFLTFTFSVFWLRFVSYTQENWCAHCCISECKLMNKVILIRPSLNYSV